MMNSNLFKSRYHWLFTLLVPSALLSQKWYVNDENRTGDVFTTAIGSKYNSGKTNDAPHNSLTYILQNAKKGDTVFIDFGNYPEISSNGTILIPKPEGVTIVVYTDMPQLKNEFPKDIKATAEEFYILNDKPVCREEYLKSKSKR